MKRTIGTSTAALDVQCWGPGTPSVVILHDGLGSVSQWRGVPMEIAQRTGLTVAAYDRAGHGSSLPVPEGPWPADWLHREAHVLGEVLDAMRCAGPILVGHSDGGSIALLYAAMERSPRPSGVVALAPHSFVEPVCADKIGAMRRDPDAIVAALARHHRAPGLLFEAWSGVWTSAAFRPWDIRDVLGSVRCPVVVAQGSADEYATDRQLSDTVKSLGSCARAVRLEGIGHLIHHSVPSVVVDLVAEMADQHLR